MLRDFLEMSCCPQFNCAVIVHQYSQPKNSECSHQVLDCICGYGVSHVFPMLPVRCEASEHDSSMQHGCDCGLCKIFLAIRNSSVLQGIKHMYCLGTVVMKNGYVLYDYSNVVFKFISSENISLDPIVRGRIEMDIWNMCNKIVKNILIEKVKKIFELGVGTCNKCEVIGGVVLDEAVGALDQCEKKKDAMVQGKKEAMVEEKKDENKKLEGGWVRGKVMPMKIVSNSVEVHESMRMALFERRGMHGFVRNNLQNMDYIIGSVFFVTTSREQLDCNSILLINENESVDSEESLYEYSDVSEGSIVKMGDGEIRIGFPIAFKWTTHSQQTGLSVCSTVPLHMKDENVLFTIRMENIDKHRSWEKRAILCFPLAIQTKQENKRRFLPEIQIHNQIGKEGTISVAFHVQSTKMLHAISGWCLSMREIAFL